MRVAVASCWKYADAWPGFDGLFKKFWPGQSYTLITDSEAAPRQWCEVVADYAKTHDGLIVLTQEDLFLSAPVQQDLIDHAVQQMGEQDAGMVRLYPCPGADEDYGDPYYGLVKKGSRYRISCQMSLWRNDYLYAIASRFNTPAEFEIGGTEFAETLPDKVLAFKREVKPWVVENLCSAIGRGLWSQDAKRLCDLHGIEVDWTMRGFQQA